MNISSAKAAMLVKSREPLVVDEIACPDMLDAAPVLVKALLALYMTVRKAKSSSS